MVYLKQMKRAHQPAEYVPVPAVCSKMVEHTTLVVAHLQEEVEGVAYKNWSLQFLKQPEQRAGMHC